MSVLDFTPGNFFYSSSDRNKKLKLAVDLQISFLNNFRTGRGRGFVDWSNEDELLVDDLAEELRSKGWLCWIERDQDPTRNRLFVSNEGPLNL